MLRARLHRLIVLCAVLFGALNATAGHGHHVRMADPALQSFFATGGTMEDLCGEGAEQVGPVGWRRRYRVPSTGGTPGSPARP
ncbi:MAG: hypothetical protein AAFR40_04880, partial [Pseudomonadota bacterium]